MRVKLLLFSVLAIFFLNSFGQGRLVLWEQFTSATCGPCATVNPDIKTLLDANPDKVVALKYQVWWPAPGSDPMYQHDPVEIQYRTRDYYVINSVPRTVLDGGMQGGTPSQTALNTRQAVNSPFTINLTHEVVAGVVNTSMSIDALENVSGNLVAHIVVVEKHIAFDEPAATNGETDFYNVVKKMLPNHLGTSLSNFAADDHREINESWTMTNVYDDIQIAVVAFIQDNDTKEVLQTAYSQPFIPDVVDVKLKKITNVSELYCGVEVTFQPHIKIENRGKNPLTSLTIEYSVNNDSNRRKTYNWTGNLPFLGTAEIELDGITVDLQADNELSITLESPNGTSDANPDNNTKSFSFTEAKNVAAPIKLELKPDNYPDEISWKVLDSDKNELYSGGNYTSNSIKRVTFNLFEPGCYDFLISDSYGDGLTSSGYVELTDDNDMEITHFTGRFSLKSIPFKVVKIPVPNVNISPSSGSTGVLRDKKVSFSFSLPVRLLNDDPITDPAALITYKKTDENGEDVPFTATISDTKKFISLTVAGGLDANTQYYVAIGATVENITDIPIEATTASFTTGAATGIESIVANAGVLLYPVPAVSTLHIQFQLLKAQAVRIELFDNSGKLLKIRDLGKMFPDSYTIEEDVNGLSSGIYNLVIWFGNEKISSKITVK